MASWRGWLVGERTNNNMPSVVPDSAASRIMAGVFKLDRVAAPGEEPASYQQQSKKSGLQSCAGLGETGVD